MTSNVSSPESRIGRWSLIVLLCAAGAAVFAAGIRWGLPSRQVDRYLFGEQPVWSGEKILHLAGDRAYDPALGADVDRTPLHRRDRILPLNDTDRQRAAILVRYRLYTHQPDEMITMMSLASMQPGEGDFDPKLYQYGGLWIYAVGALLQAGAMVGYITLTPDLAWYLDHPEAFARFYVIARLYSAAWGVVGVWAVFWLLRRMIGGLLLPAAGAAGFILMPVVVNMAHEAKPHLAGAVLMLLAVMAGVKCVETGLHKWWLAAGALCGAAAGMVISALPIFFMLPVMALLAQRSWRRAVWVTVGAGLVGIAVYFLTNPYVAINLVINQQVLRSNLENSMAMYEFARWREGLVNAAVLLAEGASLVIALAGVAGLVALLIHRVAWASRPCREAEHGRDAHAKDSIVKSGQAVAWMLGVPVALICVQFVGLGAGKPAEYGRFALLPDIALVIAAVTAVGVFVRPQAWRVAAVAVLVAGTALPGSAYLAGFIRDSTAQSSRLLEAKRLQTLLEEGAQTLAIAAEPAPYSVPPVNLFQWQIMLLPEEHVLRPDEEPADVIVRAVDVLRAPVGIDHPGYEWRPHPAVAPRRPASISWADKPFEVLISRRVASRQQDGLPAPAHR